MAEENNLNNFIWTTDLGISDELYSDVTGLDLSGAYATDNNFDYSFAYDENFKGLDLGSSSFILNSEGGKENADNDGTPKSSAPFRYPYTKIEEHDDYLRLEIVEFVPPGIQRGGDQLRMNTSDDIPKKDVLYTIMLPIPQGIEDNKGASWSDSNMGAIAALTAAAVKKGMQTEGSIASMAGASFSEIQSQLNSLSQTDRATIGNMLTGTTASLVASALTGSEAGNIFGRETGLTVNKNQQLLFDGITARSFSFNWDIVPRSDREAQQVKVIIRLLKQAMSPQRGGRQTVQGLFLKSPDVFYLTYMHGKDMHPFLNAFKPCALTGMTVNYTGSGTYATYRDGTPVHLNLSLNFSELTAVYREDYVGPNSGDGVGY